MLNLVSVLIISDIVLLNAFESIVLKPDNALDNVSTSLYNNFILVVILSCIIPFIIVCNSSKYDFILSKLKVDDSNIGFSLLIIFAIPIIPSKLVSSNFLSLPASKFPIELIEFSALSINSSLIDTLPIILPNKLFIVSTLVSVISLSNVLLIPSNMLNISLNKKCLINFKLVYIFILSAILSCPNDETILNNSLTLFKPCILCEFKFLKLLSISCIISNKSLLI